MKWLKKIFDPLIAFIGIQVIWILVVVFWILWFVARHKELRELARRYHSDFSGPGFNWAVLTVGLVLLVLILAGIYIIFIYWRRQTKLYREQKEITAQVTHELKSPLASIQLHLETIRLRKPAPDKLERFLDTMLADTDRLNNLISNLLMAAKLEHRRRRAQYPVIDFSAFVAASMESKRAKLPEGGNLSLQIEPGLRLAADVEEMQTALRNLYENAVLYSPGAPDIRVELKRTGRFCQLTFKDRGMGIDAADLKQVFSMFYRVRQPGENIRGTGLGLHIVKSVIAEHGGKVRVESEGRGKGCTFIITLPLAT
ncbi:MAG: sensor histidine kinase [Geobacter sp.]|nr:MAG: sensor histidine kinase [Geobacter sp.]